MLATLDEPLKELHRRQFEHMRQDQLQTLIGLLRQSRNENNISKPNRIE
jgi:hypothetical protein